MPDEFKIIIEDGTGGPSASEPTQPSERSPGGGGMGLAEIATLVAGALGPIAIIAQIVQSFKPLFSLIKQVVRVIVEFLRPVAEMLMLLLKPILEMLRPILMVFREIMAPFRKIAFAFAGQASKARAEGDIAGANKLQSLSFAASLAGIGAGIVAILGEVLKTQIDLMSGLLIGLITGLGDLLKSVFPVFSDGIDAGVDSAKDAITSASTLVKGVIDDAISLTQKTGLLSIEKLAETLGVKIDGTFTDLITPGSTIESAIDGFKISFEGKVADIFDDAKKQITQPGGASSIRKRNIFYSPPESNMDNLVSTASALDLIPIEKTGG